MTKKTAREPRISRAARSTSPRLSKARGKLVSHVTGAVTVNTAGYLTPTSHNKFAKILTWLFKASVNGSMVSSTPRPQMQNVTMFQRTAKALYRRFPGNPGVICLNIVAG